MNFKLSHAHAQHSILSPETTPKTRTTPPSIIPQSPHLDQSPESPDSQFADMSCRMTVPVSDPVGTSRQLVKREGHPTANVTRCQHTGETPRKVTVFWTLVRSHRSPAIWWHACPCPSRTVSFVVHASPRPLARTATVVIYATSPPHNIPLASMDAACYTNGTCKWTTKASGRLPNISVIVFAALLRRPASDSDVRSTPLPLNDLRTREACRVNKLPARGRPLEGLLLLSRVVENDCYSRVR